jgi:hypothetical protein
MQDSLAVHETVESKICFRSSISRECKDFYLAYIKFIDHYRRVSNMRNKFLFGVMGLMLILEVLLISQEALGAQWCRADCGNGVFVVCEGVLCLAETGSGCISLDKNGKIVHDQPCPSGPWYA